MPKQNREYKTFDWYLERAQLAAKGLRVADAEAGDSEDDFFSDNEGEDDMDRFEIDEK